MSQSTRPEAEETAFRRKLVRDMILKDGITNREEIRRRLKSEHGIDVHRTTVYNDFKYAARLSEKELSEFEMDIMGMYKKYIREMEVLIANENDRIKKARLIKDMSQIIKDKHTVAANIAMRGSDRSKARAARDGSRREEVSIMFSDQPQPLENVDESETEDD